MTETGFAAQLAEDLDADDLRMVLGVFRDDVERLTGVLAEHVAAGDVAAARRTCHAIAGAAGAVGAEALESACREIMIRPGLTADDLPDVQGCVQVLGAAALDEMVAFLATLPHE